MDTIKSSAEISALFNEGRRINTHDVTLIVRNSEEQHDLNGRVAFIAGKKLGNAVWRNRAKRRMRALCRETGGPYKGYDVVFLARSSVTKSQYGDMKRSIERALDKAGIR